MKELAMRPSEGRMSVWPVAVIVFAGILAALSIESTVELTNVPPSDFVTLRASAVPPKTTLAEGYWQVAERVIQWKYNRTSALPEQMPPEFRLAGEPATVEARAARAAYWAKLRQEWLRPENWHTSYRFDGGWPLRDARGLSREVLRFINQT
jgi:hypothetical protein